MFSLSPLIGLIYCLFIVNANASEVLSDDISTDKSKVSYGFDITLSSNAYEMSSVDNRSFLDLDIYTSYSLNDRTIFSIMSGMSKPLQDTREEAIKDSFLSTSYLVHNSSTHQVRQSLSLVLPTSEYSRAVLGLNLMAVSKSQSHLKLDSILSGLGMMNAVSLGLADHTNNVSSTGESNSRYFINLQTGVSYSINEQLQLNLNGSILSAYTYASNRKPSIYSLEESISYQFIKSSILKLAHSNRERLYKSDGISSDLSFFSNRGSQYYLTYSFSF